MLSFQSWPNSTDIFTCFFNGTGHRISHINRIKVRSMLLRGRRLVWQKHINVEVNLDWKPNKDVAPWHQRAKFRLTNYPQTFYITTLTRQLSSTLPIYSHQVTFIKQCVMHHNALDNITLIVCKKSYKVVYQWCHSVVSQESGKPTRGYVMNSLTCQQSRLHHSAALHYINVFFFFFIECIHVDCVVQSSETWLWAIQ